MHAWACLTTFISGLLPFQQMWCPIVLLFEASTPFLHIRKYMIYANKTDGAAFKVVELLFALLFFLCRIVMGLSLHSTMWLRQLLDLIRAGTTHSNAICYLFFVSGNLHQSITSFLSLRLRDGYMACYTHSSSALPFCRCSLVARLPALALQINCLLLSGLNVYWFSVMVRNAACPKQERKPAPAPAGQVTVEDKKKQ